MNICYFGKINNWDVFNSMSKKSSAKPSEAPQVHEYNILKGLSENLLETDQIEINTYMQTAAFPGGTPFAWGRHREKIAEGMFARRVPAVNIQILKQLTLMCSSLAILISWAIRNRREKNKCILLYLVYMPVALPALLVSKLSGSKTVVIVPDLAEYIFTYQKQRGLRGLLLRAFSSLNIVLQSKFDGYVLLTKYMNEKLNPHNRPSIVIDGFINPEDFAGKSANKEPDIHPIMYAGILSALYGLQALIKGFMTLTDESLRLWIFGAGELEDEIKAYEREDPRIVFFGKRRRDEVLEYELKADLLVNIRPVNNEFTKYSFPSKMIEYMASGMPVLTTALPGIPDEYFDYVYLLRDESIDAITKKLSDLFSIDRQEYFEKGKVAKEFILNKKNYIYQAKKMLDFLNMI